MRYAGQNCEREIPLQSGPFTEAVAQEMIDRFSRAHDEFYGFSLEGEPVEFVHLRVTAIGPTDLEAKAQAAAARSSESPIAWRPVSFRGRGFLETPVFRRESLGAGTVVAGPAIIEEPDSTIVVHPDDALVVRPDGLLELNVG
jgi:N-methylhydantoinase A